jgi:TPR repeat protein
MGTWAVSFQALPNLKANLPSDLSGQATLTIQLVSMDGIVLAETSTVLVMEVARMPEPPRAPERNVEAAKPVEPPTRPRLSPDERQRAEKLVSQGDRYLESGNVAIARQFFERATDIGFAVAALRLAATYDPNELTRIGAKGVVPSLAEARKWYERAKQLGAPEADERLTRLTN